MTASSPSFRAATAELGRLLSQAGLRRSEVDEVVQDAAWRMTALANAQRDGMFRAATATALEEATHYAPKDVPLLVRLFAVGAVRNSLLEKYHADPINRPDDHHMRTVMAGTVKAFHKLGIGSFAAEARDDSYWKRVAARFPAALHALDAWAQLQDGGSVSYEPVSVGELVPLPRAGANAFSGGYIVANGIDPLIDFRLASAVNELRAGKLDLLFVPSFKHLTRHSEKLLSVLEHILSSGCSLLTLNALIRNGYVARRRHLIRPAHSSEWVEDLKRHDGMEEAHRQALNRLR